MILSTIKLKIIIIQLTVKLKIINHDNINKWNKNNKIQ